MIDDPDMKYSVEGKLLCNTTDQTLYQKFESFTRQVTTMFAEKEPDYFVRSADFYDAKENYWFAHPYICKTQNFIIEGVFNGNWDGLNEAKMLEKEVKKMFDDQF